MGVDFCLSFLASNVLEAVLHNFEIDKLLENETLTLVLYEFICCHSRCKDFGDENLRNDIYHQFKRKNYTKSIKKKITKLSLLNFLRIIFPDEKFGGMPKGNDITAYVNFKECINVFVDELFKLYYNLEYISFVGYNDYNYWTVIYRATKNDRTLIFQNNDSLLSPVRPEQFFKTFIYRGIPQSKNIEKYEILTNEIFDYGRQGKFLGKISATIANYIVIQFEAISKIDDSWCRI